MNIVYSFISVAFDQDPSGFAVRRWLGLQTNAGMFCNDLRKSIQNHITRSYLSIIHFAYS